MWALRVPQGLRRLCDEHGIVMIADEVQTGVARTGKMFCIEHSGVVPDLITMAKGLGGGFPLSAVTGRATIMDAAHPGGLGGTYGGNPISIAAAHAVLDVVESEDLCGRATRVGQKMRSRLEALPRKCPVSAMCAAWAPWWPFELVKDPKTKEPDAEPRRPSGACREARLDSPVLWHLGQCGALAGAAHHSRQYSG
jgi:4-aminobutyrate aminotransferase